MGDATRQTVFRLAYGVVLHATDDGLVVERAQAHRVRLHDAALEQKLVESLARTGDTADLARDVPTDQLERALAPLRALGALVPSRSRITLVDRLGVGLRSNAGGLVPVETPAAIERSDLTLVLARRQDEIVGECLARCAALGNEALVVWTSPGEVVAVVDDAVTAPCARYALAFDARAPHLSMAAPFERGTTATSDHAEVERGFAAAVAARYLANLRPLAPGRASVWNIGTGTSTLADFPRHPACVCADRASTVPTSRPAAEWDALEAARFTPVTPLGDAGGIARVAYRGARQPWPLSQSSCGIAIAAGEGRRARAVGEAIERFAMLHAPSQVRACPRRLLADPALGEEAIASLLFRDVDYALEDFRFGPYDDTLPLDWTWAVQASSGERVLVPTSLVGRPREGSPRLADGTSNGYAAHRTAEEARTRALLEVVERDALLLRWYTDQGFTRVVGASVPAGVLVLLATADIDLPVLLAAACLPEGSLRIGSASATTFETALRRALRELDGQLAGGSVGAPVDLTRVSRGFGPRDHVAYYAGNAGRALFEHWLGTPLVASAEALRARWRETARPLETAVDAVRAAKLDVFFVDRSLPELFGDDWYVVRALVPGAVEMSWGTAYRRLASPRIARFLTPGAEPSRCPHPFA